jgi:hypothetical protein
MLPGCFQRPQRSALRRAWSKGSREVRPERPERLALGACAGLPDLSVLAENVALVGMTVRPVNVALSAPKANEAQQDFEAQQGHAERKAREARPGVMEGVAHKVPQAQQDHPARGGWAACRGRPALLGSLGSPVDASLHHAASRAPSRQYCPAAGSARHTLPPARARLRSQSAPA